MKTIWKFPLEVIDYQTLKLPADAEILDVQVQAGTPCLWAMLDPTAARVVKEIRTHGTGHEFTDLEGFKHVGTYQLSGGALVFHVFVSAP